MNFGVNLYSFGCCSNAQPLVLVAIVVISLYLSASSVSSYEADWFSRGGHAARLVGIVQRGRC